MKATCAAPCEQPGVPGAPRLSDQDGPSLQSLWPLGVRPTYLEAAWKHVDMNMLSTLGPNKK